MYKIYIRKLASMFSNCPYIAYFISIQKHKCTNKNIKYLLNKLSYQYIQENTKYLNCFDFHFKTELHFRLCEQSKQHYGLCV